MFLIKLNKQTLFFNLNFIDLYEDPETTKLFILYNPHKTQLYEYFYIYRTAQKIHNFRGGFILHTLILLILNTLNSTKFSLRIKTVMLHIVMMSETFLLHFALD